MKILKQNGDNGKILRAQGSGKVLKQNYNFSTKIIGQGDVSKYLKVHIPQTIQLSDNAYSVMCWQQFPNEDIIPKCKRGFYNVFGGDDGLAMRSDGVTRTYAFIVNTINSSANISLPSTLGGKEMNAYVQDSNGATLYLNNSTNSKNDYTDNATIDNINILSDVVLYQSGSGFNVSTWCFYNRKINPEEVEYYFNKGLGNDVLSKNKLLYYFNFKLAELLDFSDAQDGSDMRIGVRNSGEVINGHAEFIGLPAGTIQEQLDYANTNLFQY